MCPKINPISVTFLEGFSGCDKRKTLITQQDKPNSQQLSNHPRVNAARS